MSFLLQILFLTYGALAILYCANKIIVQAKPEYLLVFVCLFAPSYTTILSLAYQVSGSAIFVSFFRYSKEILTLSALAVTVLGHKNPLEKSYRLIPLDFTILAFLALSFVFALVPIGPSLIVDKLIYFKNLLLLGIMYFLGRNIKLTFSLQKKIFSIIVFTAMAAFLVIIIEKATNTHIQSIIGYSQYNWEVMGIKPTGNYGLQWTFEAPGAVKRFGAFYHSPLALAASTVLAIVVTFALFTSVKHSLNKAKYGIIILIAIITLVFAYSRAAVGGLFLSAVFIIAIFGYKRLIYLGLSLIMALVVYLYFFAPEDVYYYAIDTISFADSSSLGHINEWLEGVESVNQYPFGYGLATSGNVGGVDEDLQLGGENQYVVFAVQLGYPGLLIYIATIILTISTSLKAYNLTGSREDKIIPLITATFKIGLLFLMMFSNTENYGNISYIIWWFAGTSASVYFSSRKDTMVPLNLEFKDKHT